METKYGSLKADYAKPPCAFTWELPAGSKSRYVADFSIGKTRVTTVITLSFDMFYMLADLRDGDRLFSRLPLNRGLMLSRNDPNKILTRYIQSWTGVSPVALNAPWRETFVA